MSNQHGPYAWGDTHATMGRTVRGEAATLSKSPNRSPVQIGGCNSPP
jgi:hypothetical protein